MPKPTRPPVQQPQYEPSPEFMRDVPEEPVVRKPRDRSFKVDTGDETYDITIPAGYGEANVARNRYNQAQQQRAQDQRNVGPQQFNPNLPGLGQRPDIPGVDVQIDFDEGYFDNYWQDPIKVARYYNFIQTAPAGWEAPPWLDVEAVEQAYKWFEYRNDGAPWREWKRLPDDDPATSFLQFMEPPPMAFAWPGEEEQLGRILANRQQAQQQAQAQALYDANPDYYEKLGYKKVGWPELPGWQKVIASMFSPQPGLAGRPEWSRLTAAAGQGALAGLGGAAAGAAIGGLLGFGFGSIPGSVIGAMAIGLPTMYQAYTGTYVPGIDEILTFMDILAQSTERGIGIFSMAQTEGLGEVLSKFPESWKAAGLTYETTQTDLLNIVAKLAGDEPAAANEVWQFTQGYIDPVPLLNSAGQASSVRGGEALIEVRDRMLGPDGEDIYMLFAEYTDRFGDTGTFNDFIIQSLVDPMNLAGQFGSRAGQGVGKVAGSIRMAEAFRNTRGNLFIDALPMGLQQLVSSVTKAKGSDGIISAVQTYKSWVQNGVWTPKVLASLPKDSMGNPITPSAADLSKFDKWAGGLDDAGKIKELLPSEGKQSFIKSWRELTPESKATLMLYNLDTNLSEALFNVDDPTLSNVERAEVMVGMMDQYANVSAKDVGQVGGAMLASPMTATTQMTLKNFNDSPVMQTLVAEWAGAQERITMLNNMADEMGIDPAKLVEQMGDDYRATFDAVYQAIKKSDNPASNDILAAIDAGELTPEIMADTFAIFTGKKSAGDTIPGQAWTFEDWRARVMNAGMSHATENLISQYGLQAAGTFTQAAGLLKSVQSLLLLDLNPGYLVNNVINNWVTRAAEGVMGVMTPRQVEAWFNRFGYTPGRAGASETASSIGSTGGLDAYIGQITDVTRGDTSLTKMVRQVNKARKKFGIMGKLSSMAEGSNSRAAYAIGMQKMWGRMWKPDTGFTKMSPGLTQALTAVNPQLPDMIHAAIRGSVNMQEVEAALFDGVAAFNIGQIIDDAVNVISPANPEAARELLRATGLEDELSARLQKAETNQDVDDALNGMEKIINDSVETKVLNEIVNTFGEVSARIQAEGFQAGAELFTEAQVRLWERWLTHFREINELTERTANYGYDAKGAVQRNAEWRAQYARESVEWKRVQAFELQMYDAVLDKMASDPVKKHRYMEAVSEQQQAWRDFYEGYEIDSVTGERTTIADAKRAGRDSRHVDGRNDIYRKLYSGDDGRGFKSKAAQNRAWDVAKKKIQKMYDATFETEMRTSNQVSELFGDIFENDGGSKAEAIAWRKQVMDIRTKMKIAMDGHRKMLQDTNIKADDKRAAWNVFIEKEYKPLINKLKRAEIEGAKRLGGDLEPIAQQPLPTEPISPVGETAPQGEIAQPDLTVTPEGEPVVPGTDVPTQPPPPVDATPIEITKAHAEQQALRERARSVREDAKIRHQGKLDRKAVLDQLEQGFDVSKQEMAAVTVLMDTIAERWAERTGKSPEQWYTEHIAGVEYDGHVDPELYQLPPEEGSRLRLERAITNLEAERTRLGHDALSLDDFAMNQTIDPADMQSSRAAWQYREALKERANLDTTKLTQYKDYQAMLEDAKRNDPRLWQEDELQTELDNILDEPVQEKLVALHNLTGENILQAAELGGLALPSIAVVKAGAEFESFGEITLIGDRHLIDPERAAARVFDADVYSPTHPEKVWNKVKMAAAEKVDNKFRHAQEVTGRIGSGPINEMWDAMINYPNKQKALELLENSDEGKIAYLQEKHGVEIKPERMRRHMHNEFVNDPEFIELFSMDEGKLKHAKPVDDNYKHLSSLIDQAINRHVENTYSDKRPKLKEGLRSALRDNILNEDGYLRYHKLYGLLEDIRTVTDNVEVVDQAKLHGIIETNMNQGERRAGYQEWVRDTLNVYGYPKLKLGGKKVPYTFGNVVDAMLRKSVRASEETMTFGPGKVRAKGAREFKNIQQMRKKSDMLASKLDVHKFIDDVQEPIRDEYITYLTGHYKYSDTWAGMDAAYKALADYVSKGKKRSPERMRSALQRNDFIHIEDVQVEKAIAAAESIINAPTEYFEAKMQRGVDIGEFKYAAVEEGTPANVLKVLDDAGVEYAIYEKYGLDSRQQAVSSFYDKGDVMFQDVKGGVRFMDDGRAIISAMKSPDLSTMVHEVAHIFRRDLDASDLNVTAQWGGLKDGVEFTRLQQEFTEGIISEADRKRYVDAEEKFARGWERYLAEDQAAIEGMPAGLRNVFKQFSDFLMKLYKKITGSSIDVDISPEMKGVFDRVLFSDEQRALMETQARHITEYTDQAQMVVDGKKAVTPEDKAAVIAAGDIHESLSEPTSRRDGAVMLPEWLTTTIDGEEYNTKTRYIAEAMGATEVGTNHWILDWEQMSVHQRRKLSYRMAKALDDTRSNINIQIELNDKGIDLAKATKEDVLAAVTPEAVTEYKPTGQLEPGHLFKEIIRKQLGDEKLSFFQLQNRVMETNKRYSQDSKAAIRDVIRMMVDEGELVQSHDAEGNTLVEFAKVEQPAIPDPEPTVYELDWVTKPVKDAALPKRITDAIRGTAGQIGAWLSGTEGPVKIGPDVRHGGIDFTTETDRGSFRPDLQKIYYAIDEKGTIPTVSKILIALDKIAKGEDGSTKIEIALKIYIEESMGGTHEAEGIAYADMTYLWYTGAYDAAINLYLDNPDRLVSPEITFGSDEAFIEFIDMLSDKTPDTSGLVKPYKQVEVTPFEHGDHTITHKVVDTEGYLVAYVSADLMPETINTEPGDAHVLGIHVHDPSTTVYELNGELQYAGDPNAEVDVLFQGDEYYRGTTPGDTRRIRTGNDVWDSYLFVSTSEKSARSYGKSVSRVTLSPDAKILIEGTQEFKKVEGKFVPGESLLDFASRVTQKANEMGYDAVQFERQGDLGTAIMNRDIVSEMTTLYQKKNKQQMGFFDESQADLPLFSGTPQKAQGELFKARAEARQLGMFEQPGIEAKVVGEAQTIAQNSRVEVDALTEKTGAQSSKPKAGITREQMTIAFARKGAVDLAKSTKYSGGETIAAFVDRYIADGWEAGKQKFGAVTKRALIKGPEHMALDRVAADYVDVINNTGKLARNYDLPTETQPGMLFQTAERQHITANQAKYDAVIDKIISTKRGEPLGREYMSDEAARDAYHSGRLGEPETFLYYKGDKSVNVEAEHVATEKFVVSPEPLKPSEIVDNNLVPFFNADGLFIKDYYQQVYGQTDRMLLMHADDPNRGAVITKWGDRYRWTFFDERGFVGHNEENSLDIAVNEAAKQHYGKPADPASLDSLVTKPGSLFQDAPPPLKAQGDLGLGDTPVPLNEGSMMDEANTTQIRPMMEQIGVQAKQQISNKNLKHNIPQNLMPQINEYMGGLKKEMSSARLASVRYGEQMRDISLLNYQKRYGFDTALSAVFPYQLWYTRSMMNWAQRMIDKPQWFSMYARIREMQRKQENEGIPTRMKGKMRMPAPYLPDWAGGFLYFDPLSQLFPFDNFAQPFDSMRVTRSAQNQKTYEILRQMLQDGQVSETDYNTAIESKEGFMWDKAWAQAGAESETDTSPLGLVNMMMSPALYIDMPNKLLTGRANELSPLPPTRLGQALETTLKDTPLEPLGDIAGKVLAGPERYLRKKAGLSEFGEWGDYYVDRMLSNMAADGEVDTKSVIMAMQERQGPLYEEAYKRVQQEVALRIPGMSAIAAAKGGSITDFLMTAPASLFPGSLLPTGELESRNLRDVYSKAWEQYKQGDTEAIDQFFEDYPEYKARLALFDEPEERTRNFLVTEIWDRYSELTGPNKRMARDQLPGFQDAFYNPDTRDYEAIKLDTLAYWSKLLGGLVPETEQTQQGLQTPGQIDLYPEGDADVIQTYWDERSSRFPNIQAIQSAYYDQGRDPKVLQEFPQLREYWDWKKQYEKDHPEIKQYNDIQAAKYDGIAFGGSRAGIEDSRQFLTQQEIGDFSEPLVMQLATYYYTGGELSSGALSELHRVWELQGQPGGTFENYLENVVRDSLMEFVLD